MGQPTGDPIIDAYLEEGGGVTPPPTGPLRKVDSPFTGSMLETQRTTKPQTPTALEGGDKQLSLNHLLDAFSQGLIDEKTLRDRLLETGYDNDDITLLEQLVAKKPKEVSFGELGQAVANGTIDDKEFSDRLRKMGFSEEDVALLHDSTLADIKAGRTKRLGTSTTLQAWQSGTISPGTARQRLTDEGYSESDVALMLKMGHQQLNAAKQKAAAPKPEPSDQQRRPAPPTSAEPRSATKRTLFQGSGSDFVNQFHESYVDQLRTAGLGPQATSWLLDNMDVALDEQLRTSGGRPREGGVLSAPKLMTLYEGQRGARRREGSAGGGITARQI